MPGTRCNVSTCNNSLLATKKLNQAISYHTFPKDEKVQEVWAQRCQRDGKWNRKSCYICSIHFRASDYQRDFQGELLGIPRRKVLRKDAVPSLNLPDIKATIGSSRELRSQKRKRKTKARKSSPSDLTNNTNEIETTTNQENVTLESIQAKLKLFEETNAELKLENATLRNQLENQTLLLDQYKQELGNEKSTREEKLNIEIKVKMLLSQCFTDSQIDLLINKKKSVQWNDDDILRAFTLRYFSKRAYIYLRQKLGYPLPSVSSLQRWASSINMRSGILTDVLIFLDVAGKCMSEQEKLVLIQFDEMKVSDLYEYDRKNDQIVGPCFQMQVVMARGLFSSWKVPIYVEFDQKMTAEILLHIISTLYNLGFQVIACVSDCGPWKTLNISMDNTSFKHPDTCNNIYMFADTPHLLKLLRDWFGEHLDLRNNSLDAMYDMVWNMICCKKRSLQVFEKAILMSITSLKNLFQDVQDRYKMDYITTNRLNQDSLENLFSQIRARGGPNDHPTPLSALCRIRMIVLGKSTNTKTSNTDGKGEDEYIVGQVLSRTGIKFQERAINMLDPLNIDTEPRSDCGSNLNSMSTSSSEEINDGSNHIATEEDALYYLAGWIAKKLNITHPHLGTFAHELHDCLPSWIKHLSSGGLIEPSKSWQYEIKFLESNFREIFGNPVNRSKNINEKVFNEMIKTVNIDETVIKTFIRQRILIRVKYLNFLRSKEKTRNCKRLRAENDIARKTTKKRKKNIN